MELAKVIQARSIWLFDPEELNPRGRSIQPIHEALKNRYGFERLLNDEIAQKGVRFLDGRFVAGQSEIDIDLTLYSDGAVAISRSDTKDTDAFLRDALDWFEADFGLRGESYALKVKKAYRSDLVVFAPSIRLLRMSEKVQRFAEQLAKAALQVDSGHSQPVDAEALVFGSELKKSLFTFERRANVPFSEHKYYSSALLPTGLHLQFLEEFEKMFDSEA